MNALLSRGGGDSRWKRLRELLGVIGERLREAAGERERGKEFTPDDFFVVKGEALRTPEVVPPRRPRRPPEGPKGVTTQDSDEDAGPPEPDGDGRARRRQGSGGPAPNTGTAFLMRSSVLPRRNAKGEFDALRVLWRLPEGVRLPEMVGVRVRVPSGSDSTCEQPLGPEWLLLKAIEHPGGVATAGGRGETELAVPPADGALTITLAHPVGDPNAVEVDTVRRSGARERDDD